MTRLSKGGVSTKIIRGKKYYYYQWYENGKKRSKTISFDEYNRIKSDGDINHAPIYYNKIHNIDILKGEDLHKSISYLKNWKKRDSFKDIVKYLNSPLDSKVLILYGLRRTGKTTLMFQSILELEDKDKSAYLLVNSNTTMGDINLTLFELDKEGYKYIYIDEITLAKDFISSCQFLSDIYALKLKIVLSGTDSFGFYISSKENLYNRSYMIHTTYIPFKEFSRVLNIKDIDKYIEYGGTLVSEGIDYHKAIYPTFFNEQTAMEYVDTAISKNIQNSLSNYDDGSKYPRLIGEKNEGRLTSLINKVVQDNNHRFVTSIINRTFKSNDYGSLKGLLRKNKLDDRLRTILDTIDDNKIYQEMMNKLDIVNHKVDQDTLNELYEYFKEIDLIDYYQTIDFDNLYSEQNVVFTQPGLRYAQAKELIETLLYQDALLDLPIELVDIIFDTLLNDVKGRILEEIVLLDSKRNHKHQSFKASFRIGEIDMCIYNKEKSEIDLYEIKHSKEDNIDQARHLLDEEKCTRIANRYGKIGHKYVLYRGDNKLVGEIEYLNVEEYLLH